MSKHTKPKKKITVPKLYKMVQSMRPEVKEKSYLFNNVSGTNFSSISYGSGTTMAGLAAGIVQGAGTDQRVGNQVKIFGIKIYLAYKHATSDVYNNTRFFLIRPKNDKLNVGGTLIESILSGAPADVTQWAYPIDTDRYIVYMDKVINSYNRSVDGVSNAVVSPTTFIKKYIKVNATMQWDVQGILPKDFILGAISDSTFTTHPGCIAGHIKIYYTDN